MRWRDWLRGKRAAAAGPGEGPEPAATRPRGCPALLWDFEVNGRSGWPCELPADGHEWHERETMPVRARWRRTQLPGGGWKTEIPDSYVDAGADPGAA